MPYITTSSELSYWLSLARTYQRCGHVTPSTLRHLKNLELIDDTGKVLDEPLALLSLKALSMLSDEEKKKSAEDKALADWWGKALATEGGFIIYVPCAGVLTADRAKDADKTIEKEVLNRSGVKNLSPFSKAGAGRTENHVWYYMKTAVLPTDEFKIFSYDLLKNFENQCVGDVHGKSLKGCFGTVADGIRKDAGKRGAEWVEKEIRMYGSLGERKVWKDIGFIGCTRQKAGSYWHTMDSLLVEKGCLEVKL